MATMAEISTAINQIAIKKQNLRQSFLHLQSQTPSSFNLPLTWTDFDSYFTTIESSLQSKFNLLQTFPPSSDTAIVPDRSELKSLCQHSDGLGLHGFITLTGDRVSILSELPDAYRCAPDAPAMVLGAIGAFYRSDCTGTELRLFRDGCLVMLEGLVCVDRVVSIEVEEKAMEMAVEWNQKRNDSIGSCSVDEKEQIVLGFLLLLDAFRLVDRFAIDEVIDCLVTVASYSHSVDLCRRIVPADKMNDVIQRLIDKDMYVVAVKFSIQLKKRDEFPPVGLLEKRKLMAVSVIEETLNNVKDFNVHNDVTRKEINVLKSIIECIDENHLQSEYPKDNLVELVNKLENEVEKSKHDLWTYLRSIKQPTRSKRKNRKWTPKKMKRSTKPKLVELVNRLENEVENNEQTLLNDLISRKQPARLRSKKLKWSTKMKRSKKPRLNPILPSVQESHTQKADLSPDHVADCHHSPNGSGPTVSKDPYATPNGSGPTVSKDPYATPNGSGPTVSKDPYATPNGPGPTGSKDSYAAPNGSGPIGSKDSYADRGSTHTDSKDLYANQVSGHRGLDTVKIDYSFYVPQLQPPSDNNSNGWISD